MSSLFQKLSNYTPEPPAGVWEKISAALNENSQYSFAEKLYHFEASPGTGIWKNISLKLETYRESESPKVVPLYGRRNKLVKYMSAAVILIVLATGITYLFISTSNSDVAQNSNHPKTDSPGVKPSLVIPDTQAITSPNNSQENNDISKSDNAVKSKLYARYTTYTNEKGNTVRLSKKLYPVFDCADKSTALSNKKCKENIQSLQRKMATSVISPNDFAGVIDMIKSLEKEQ